MNKSNFHAVLIGFNKFADNVRLPDLKFAEKDAHDLYDLLIDPKYGGYPKENITLITGSELHINLEQGIEYPNRVIELTEGKMDMGRIERNDIETILYTQIVNNRTPDDIVLVYYSGHGFIAGKHEQAYLATPEVSILNIQNNPKAGLQMEYLHNDIFLDTKAKFVIFILDCCHSGAFCPKVENKETAEHNPPENKRLIESRYYSGEGRVAFVSSPREIPSRESTSYKNGVFTYHLLNGLRGEAVEPSGEVTVASLVSYVQRMNPVTQPPIYYGNTTRIVLANPEKPTQDEQQTYQVYPAAKIAPDPLDVCPIFLTLKNHLDDQIDFVDIITRNIKNAEVNNTSSVGNSILSMIRNSINAEFAFIQAIEEIGSEKNIVYKYQSDLNIKGFNLEEYKTLAMHDLYTQLTRKKKELLPSKYGFFKQFEGRKDTNKHIIAIPLRLEYPREFLILCGVDYEWLKYGELIGRVFKSIYESTKEFTSFRALDIEMAILDGIKRDFGHVPTKTYNYRLENFKEKLKDINFFFEPVVELGKHNPEIQSWEALARDPNTQKAPVSLFKAAELWGPAFITELDLYCLEQSINTYLELWKNEHNGHSLDPLAVNVYPDTIFRSVYKEKLEEILERELIKSRQLVLEISEKRPIPTIDRIREHVFGYYDPVEEFVKTISEYIMDLNIGFAIDDFGVGHSSISRLHRINLDHVKIDRDILLNPYPEHTIDYVRKSVNARNLHPDKIIVEGFDGKSRISLKKLYEHGIRLIQGHMIRRASPSVSHLSIEEREFIIKQLTSDETFEFDD